MRRHEGAAEGRDAQPANWRVRLNNWLHRARQTRPEEALGTWVGAVLSEDSYPLSPGQLESAKKAYLYRLRKRLSTIHLYGLDERRRELQGSGQRLDPLCLYRPLNTTIQVAVEETREDDVLAAVVPRMRARTALEAVGDERKALLKGGHGTGKSTFLRYLVLSLLEQSPDREYTGLARLQPAWKHGLLYPLWVDLRTAAAFERDDDNLAGLCAYIAAELGIYADQLCNQVLGPGGVLVILDGLEHAPEAVADLLVGMDTLTAMLSGQPNCVLVTSQPYVDHDRWAGNAFAGFAQVTLAPWHQEQLDDYARSWYAELSRKEWVDEEQARDLPGHLCSSLRRREVQALAGRPSLMAMVALLHTLRERLPTDPGMFYYALIDLMLARWSEGRGEDERDLRQAFDLDGLRSAVAQLAYQGYAHLERAGDLVEFAAGDLRTALVGVCRDGRWETVNELMARVLARPCLLDERGPERFVFVDVDLQAYVAARHLVEQPDLPQWVVDLVGEGMARWRPVVMHVLSRLVWLAQDLPAALSLVEALVRASAQEEEAQPGDTGWHMAWLAGEALAYLAQALDLGRDDLVRKVKEQLVALVERGVLSPRERAQAAKALDRLPGGDPRPGISASDSLWCEVPACPFWLGEGEEAQLIELDTYWIARYPVTNAQYRAFVEATGHVSPAHWQGRHYPPGLGNHPVANVAWEDVTAYCAWRSAHLRETPALIWRLGAVQPGAQIPARWQVRLPTSAEWEKAARGGLLVPASGSGELVHNALPRRRYPWGDHWVLSSGGTRGDETRCNVSESDIGATTPVGMYPSGASPYGLMDVAGNVWEWCLDWANEERRYKVRRGGAFRYTHEQARCSALDRAHPDLAWPYVGFRLVLGPVVTEERGKGL